MPRKNSDKKSIEYQMFMASSGFVPPDLSKKTEVWVRNALKPSWARIMAKALLCYVSAGVGVLAICPQFGIGLGDSMGVMRWFSLLGPYPCMAACGALFVGSGSVLVAALLSRDELAKLLGLRLLWSPIYAALALGALIVFGAEVAVGFGLAWWLGSVAAEQAVFQAGLRWRLQ